MPLSLTVHIEPTLRLRVHQRQEPAWKQLQRIADAAFPALQALWQTVFADVQASLPVAQLWEALASGNALLVEEVLRPLWTRLGEAQTRAVLPTLVQETVRQAAEAMLPSMQATLGTSVEVAFNVVVPETLAAIDTYIGTQIRGISDVTLQNVRQVLRQGFSEGRSVAQMARDLEAFVGLTPRQTQAIERLRERLTTEGLSAKQVASRVKEASRRALRQRVEMISRTEALAASNLGNYELMQQSIRAGFLDPAQVKRFWLTAGERTCPNICAPIPGRNMQGVGPDAVFDTPVGGLLLPPAHPQCRCTTVLRVSE